jgi:hypothetical protein
MSGQGDNRRAVWAGKISAAWRSSIEAICTVGELLSQSKADLPHGQFERMVETELPFGARTARMLAAIGKDARIRNHGSVLPSSWCTLYELTKLSDAQFEDGLRSGAIHAEMIRQDATALAFSITSAEAKAIKAARRIAESVDWAFEKGGESIAAFRESESEYERALERCESFGAFREIVKRARVEPHPGVIGAFAGVSAHLQDMRPVLEAVSDDIRRAIDKKYHGNERVRVLAELESMENTLGKKSPF